jgi:hypothetical protein
LNVVRRYSLGMIEGTESPNWIPNTLGRAEIELAQAETEYQAAANRRNALFNLVKALRNLTAAEATPGARTEPLSTEEDPREAAVAQYVLPLPAADSSEPSAVDRAVSLLREFGAPVTMRRIRTEWRARGWIDPSWKYPDTNINMAHQRALKKRLVKRVGDLWAVADAPATAAANAVVPSTQSEVLLP